MKFDVEYLGKDVSVCVSREHTFGTDSFLLADFASPKARETACDLGTGCGIIPLLWFRGETPPKKACAVDVQRQAIEQLEQAVEMSGLNGRLIPVHSDLRELKGVTPLASFDVVTSNPPYNSAGSGIPSRAESDAIARHETICGMTEWCAAAAGLLRFGGRFCLCQRPERLADAITAMRACGVEPKRIRFVQKDKSSAPWLVLLEGKRGSKPFLRAEPSLLVYENGALSEEMLKIYGMYKENPIDTII